MKLIWTKERCLEEALRYNTRGEFFSAYQTSINNNWLDDICSHMVICRNPNWTKELCLEEALKYTKSDFRKKSPSAYERSRKSGWLSDLIFIEDDL
jgi:hypothetical protein